MKMPGNYKSSYYDQFLEGNFKESVAKNLSKVIHHDKDMFKPSLDRVDLEQIYNV